MSRESQPKRLNPKQRKLAEDHVVYAKKLAAIYCRRRGILHELDEVTSSALQGLVDAVYLYCEARGVAFATFANRRIHGAIVDAIRGRDGRRTREGESGECREAKRKRRSVRSVDAVVCRDTEGHEMTIGDTMRADDDSQKRMEDADVVAKFLRSLPRRERFAYTMYHGHGWSMKQIARVAGMVESGVWHQLKRAQAIIDAEVANVV